jgi:anhydro-N-acetylmuramic acid kinase
MKNSIIGIMSGSSCDGLDVALFSFIDEDKYAMEAAKAYELPGRLKEQLMDPLSLSVLEFIKLDADFSLFTAQCVNDLIENQMIKPNLLVSHGHTIYHNPDHTISCQIINGGILASLTGIDTLSDLRIQDVALGGQGAPLASLIDHFLFDSYDISVNLGGIANVSISQAGKTLSWDVCPCNQVLNYYSSLLGHTYDEDGKLARTGSVDELCMKQWNEIPYFSRRSPKSLDNYWVREEFIGTIDKFLPPQDVLRTMCAFVSGQLVKDVNSHLPKGAKTMIITGGGAHNAFLIECIKQECLRHQIEVHIPDAGIIDFKESLLMAYMGQRYLENKNNTLSTAT